MIDEKICILLVEDELKILRVVKDLLKINGFYVLEATNGNSALDLFYENNTKIDLILLDVMLPGIDGFSVLKEIRNFSTVPVVMLTAKGEEYDQLKGFQVGADDYIPKPFSSKILLARIESVLKRSGKTKSVIISVGNIDIDAVKRVIYLNTEILELTPKEFDLIYYFVSNKGISLTREQILNSVWGFDFEGDIRTVDTHIKQLRNKLKENSKYIKTIHKIGYIFEVV